MPSLPAHLAVPLIFKDGNISLDALTADGYLTVVLVGQTLGVLFWEGLVRML
ncbi:hypothetical protein [Roseobacter sp.]|uniref:hypothetical protein n=1 Tax=Roseobacter sp. TaxID=1907202 RepID=UPI00385A6F22